MQLFFGFVGLFNILVCWPIGVVLHFTGVERLEVPSTGRVVAGLLVSVSDIKFFTHLTHKLIANDPIDGYNAHERLHLCDCNAQDDTAGGNHRP